DDERSNEPASVDEVDEQLRAVWGVSVEDEESLVCQLEDELSLETRLTPHFDRRALVRFLRARKHDLVASKQMVLKALDWRARQEVDAVLTDYSFPERPRFFEQFPEGFFCTDRGGRPVYVQQPGSINISELLKFTTVDRCIQYHVQQQERYLQEICPAASLVSGRYCEQSLVIVDLEGMGIATLNHDYRKILGEVMSIDQDNYPELMWKALVVNAPTTFRVLWGMVKYLIDARTQAKVEVLGADQAAELQRYIAPENLMTRYGGTNDAPLQDCPGPWQDSDIRRRVRQGDHLRLPCV
ncbi:hypothetical protein H632_c3363p0, partial [Helicosporidium sp. ATCC 50920]